MKGEAQAALDRAATTLGEELGVDGPALLHERETLLGIAPAGTVSAGGTCRLLPAADRWMALNLSRPDDLDAMPAWVGRDLDAPVWDAVTEHAVTITASEGVALAQLLGVPAAVAIAPEEFEGPSVSVDAYDAPVGSPRDPAPTVVDLSALWAGPLCARLVGAALGARVLKVEHIGRPDGARAGPPAFWRSLNGAKEERHLDLATTTGRAELAAVLAPAKVIVSAARPRALANLGLDPAQHAARGAIWVSITGYGLAGERADWVAFGDDAAVAGGLAVVAGSYEAPEFVGDAVADPLAGLAAAVVAVRLAKARRAGVVDVSMAGVVNRAVFPPR
jgi:CoA transferase family III